MPETQPPVVLIKKRKDHHGGHHGGAWKVAYADFVTAMMSLFIVLWLMSSSTKQQKLLIAGYFKDPRGRAGDTGKAKTGAGQNILLNKQDMTKIQVKLQQAIRKVDTENKLKHQIEMTITPEGLRIELMEDAHGTFFELGSAQPTPILQAILKVLSPR
jgi:chemotaxis protein MotB